MNENSKLPFAMTNPSVDPLSGVELNFSDNLIWVMNLCIAIIMFSVALSMKRDDFSALLKSPKQVLVGLTSQFFLLPFITFLLVLVVNFSWPFPILWMFFVIWEVIYF